MPSRSTRLAAPSLQLHAMGAAVVGRRTPVSEMATPASALNSCDLPLPVAPAMATTVCCPESLRRTAASSSTRPASARVRLSSRVRESPTSSRSASSRSRSGVSYARGGTGRGTGLRGSVAADCSAPAFSATRRAISPSSQASAPVPVRRARWSAAGSARSPRDGPPAPSRSSSPDGPDGPDGPGGPDAPRPPSPGWACSRSSRSGRSSSRGRPPAIGVLGVVLVSDGGHRSPLLLQYGQRGDEFGLGVPRAPRARRAGRADVPVRRA
ncbi:hypothetical protein SGRIM128S_06871 [Streptomyces griseomycini]